MNYQEKWLMISSYYFYAMNRASESFVFLAVRMLLLSKRKFSLWLGFALHLNIYIPVTQGLQFIKKGLGLFHFFRFKLRILQKLLKIFRNAKHLCFNALSDHCTMVDTTSFISWLPDDYSIAGLQESFPYYAKNGQKSQCFTIYNEYKQRQTKYSFFYFSNEANNKINRPMLEFASIKF